MSGLASILPVLLTLGGIGAAIGAGFCALMRADYRPDCCAEARTKPARNGHE